MTGTALGRRSFLAAGMALPILLPGPARSQPVWRARQFHNQPAASHQHGFLTDLWAAVELETGGRLAVTVHPQNGGLAGSDPAALDMLVSGELEFFTLQGNILGRVVPVAEIQGLPFAFADHAQVHRANDGALGAYLGRECAAKGIHRFQHGLLENGFRHIGTIERPVRSADDLAGLKIRVPDGQMYRDLLAELGAMPVTINVRDLYRALQERKVDGQENPLAIVEFNRLYEVTGHLALTGHMWSGFNLLANLEFWNALPGDVQAIVERHVLIQVAAQRAYTDALNQRLQATLVDRGMVVAPVDAGSFRGKLERGFYGRWRGQLGETAWTLLEESVGTFG